MTRDPYEILGVSRDADMDEIKKAYRTLSRKYHPDANLNNPNKEEAEEMFKRVQEAYQQIVDEREHGTEGGFSSDGFAGETPEEEPRMRAAVNFINSQHFEEAMRVLDEMENRGAEWYYLHAAANAGLGNNLAAREDAERAVQMDPSNLRYRQLHQQLSGMSGWYDDMSKGYGYDCSGGSAAGPLCSCCAALTCCSLCLNPFGTILCC